MKFFATAISVWLAICFSAGLVLMGADALVRSDAAVSAASSTEPTPAPAAASPVGLECAGTASSH